MECTEMRNSTDELSVLFAACSVVYVPYFVVLEKKKVQSLWRLT